MTTRERIQAAAEEESLVIGTKESLKQMSGLSFVGIASNAPMDLRERVKDAASDSVEVHELDIDNKELGSLCMKPFTASVVGITN